MALGFVRVDLTVRLGREVEGFEGKISETLDSVMAFTFCCHFARLGTIRII